MPPRLVRALAVSFLALCVTGCGTGEPGSVITRVGLPVKDAEVKVEVHETDSSFLKGAVVLVDGSRESRPRFAEELTERLNESGYSVITLPEIKTLSGEELSALLRATKELIPQTVNLSLTAFGDAGPGAWLALEDVEGLVSTAFLVSCPLPDTPIDFAALSDTGIRGVYVSGSASYKTSYWQAHRAMRELETPHDFLIYGGDIGDHFYSDPAPQAQSTWEETVKAAVDWLTIWNSAEAHHK